MRVSIVFAALVFATPTFVSAQEMTAAERASAVSRVRQMAACVERSEADLARIVRLISESEHQRDTARDARARSDAEAAIEALVARASESQARASTCFAGDALPSPGTSVVHRPPPPDAAADSVSQAGGTVREVERDTRLTETLQVERGEQVDGAGRLDRGAVRSAIRAITPRLGRCYDSWLARGSLAAHHLDLVFTFRGRGRARAVTVERSDFGDAAFDRCIRAAGQRLTTSSAPTGGSATYSYRLRFGRAR